jgi:hypothetical protein
LIISPPWRAIGQKKFAPKGFQQDSCPNIIKKEYLKKRYNLHGFAQAPVIFSGILPYIWGQYFAEVANPDSCYLLRTIGSHVSHKSLDPVRAIFMADPPLPQRVGIKFMKGSKTASFPPSSQEKAVI